MTMFHHFTTHPQHIPIYEKQISPQKCFQVPFFLVCKSHTLYDSPSLKTLPKPTIQPAVVRKVLGELDAAEFAKVSEQTVVTRASHVKRLGLGGWSTHPLWEIKFPVGKVGNSATCRLGFSGKSGHQILGSLEAVAVILCLRMVLFLDSLVCC